MVVAFGKDKKKRSSYIMGRIQPGLLYIINVKCEHFFVC